MLKPPREKPPIRTHFPICAGPIFHSSSRSSLPSIVTRGSLLIYLLQEKNNLPSLTITDFGKICSDSIYEEWINGDLIMRIQVMFISLFCTIFIVKDFKL